MFFILSLVCSSLNEAIAAALNWRAKTLERWIGSVLADPSQLKRVTPVIEQILTEAGVPADVHETIVTSVATALADTTTTVNDIKAKIAAELRAAKVDETAIAGLVERLFTEAEAERSTPAPQVLAEQDVGNLRKTAADNFFTAPAIQPLIRPSKSGPTTQGRRPSYIPSATFAAVLLEQATGGHAGDATASRLIANLPGVVGAAVADIGHVATGAATEAAGELAAMRKRLEDWYDESMKRVSGWYKRRVQVALAIIGLLVAIGLNADAIGVANSLWSDTTLRNAIVANAGRAVANPASVPSSKSIKDDIDKVHELNLPLGWSRPGSGSWNTPHSFGGWASKVGGILLTTLALMLGAPFWFDLLGRLFQIRGTGAKPTTTAPTSVANMPTT